MNLQVNTFIARNNFSSKNNDKDKIKKFDTKC